MNRVLEQPTDLGAVALVGFMGAGKSQVGRLTAVRLGLPFFDSDALIERQHGAIAEIFATHGEEVFRRLERDVVCAALAAAAARPCVIALGGGAVLSGDVREALRQLPHVVWLTAPPDILWRRVEAEAFGARPLALDAASFRRLFAERTALYASVATDVVANDGVLPLDEVATAVAQVVQRPASSAARVPKPTMRGDPTANRP